MKKLATFYPNPILDSIAVSVFDDILVELINTVSDGKIQKTILIMTRCLVYPIHNVLIETHEKYRKQKTEKHLEH